MLVVVIVVVVVVVVVIVDCHAVAAAGNVAVAPTRYYNCMAIIVVGCFC